MRVGVNCYMLRADIGGMKQYFITLFDWLFQNDGDNQYILFHFDHNLDELARLEGASWGEHGIRLSDQREIPALLDGIDVYFCPFGPLYPKPAPAPSVITLADIQEVFYPEFFTEEEHLSRIDHFRGSARMADRIITVSEYSRTTINKHYGVPADRISVAYHAPDRRFERAAEIEEPPEAPCPVKFLLYPSNRWEHKNHDALLRALRILKREGLEPPLVVTGYDTPTSYPLGKKIREYGLESQIVDAGYVSLPQLAYLYRRARLVVIPSLFEGFGMPVIEAMAAGAPVAASNVCSLPEVGRDAVEYFDPKSPEEIGSVISKYWNSDEACRERVELGRARITHFTREKMARAHIEAFQAARSGYSHARHVWRKAVVSRLHRRAVEWHAHHPPKKARRPDGADSLDVRYRSGWHAPEMVDGEPLRWSEGRGLMTIETPEAVAVTLSGKLYSLRQPNDVTFKLNGEPVHTIPMDGEGFGIRELGGLELHLRPGKNRLEILSRNPPAIPDGDTRKLAVAAVNFRFNREAAAGV